MIIGMTGPKGSGKDAVASILASGHGFYHLKFAHALKEMMRALLYSCDLKLDTIERMIEGDLKEEPHHLLLGQTPRRAMQTLGTEWGRDTFGRSFWINIIGQRIKALPAGADIVVSDVRFDNEAEMLRRLGAYIIGREGTWTGGHTSERGLEPHLIDFVMPRSETLNDLADDVRGMLAGLRAMEAA